MKNYNKDLDALNMPWVDSPFFPKLIENVEISKNEIQIAKDFYSKGYVIIDLELSASFIDDLNNEIQTLLKSENIKTNSSFFSYNSSPRIVDAGKDCSRVVDLALNEKVLSLLKLFYRKKPIPFSTINFLKLLERSSALWHRCSLVAEHPESWEKQRHRPQTSCLSGGI